MQGEKVMKNKNPEQNTQELGNYFKRCNRWVIPEEKKEWNKLSIWTKNGWLFSQVNDGY